MKKVIIRLLPYQARVVEDTESIVCGIIGGTGTGKTWLIPRWLLINMQRNPNQEWIVSSPTISMLKKNPIKYIKRFFDEIEFPYTYKISDSLIETPIGMIYFISAENPDRMQGIHAKGIIGDEAGMYESLWWETAIQRARFNEGQVLLVTTPYMRNWLYNDVVVDSEAFEYHIEQPSSLDNPYYNQKQIEIAEKTLPRWKFEMLYKGLFTVAEGRIYSLFDEHIIPFPLHIPDGYRVIRGLDYGYNNPTAVVWAATKDNIDWYIYREYKQSGLTNNEIVKFLYADGKDILTYIDPSAAGLIEECKRNDINVARANNDVLPGILYTYSLVQQKHLWFESGLKDIFSENQNYVWKSNKGATTDKPVKENDHLMDALRYALYSWHIDNKNSTIEYVPWSTQR